MQQAVRPVPAGPSSGPGVLSVGQRAAYIGAGLSLAVAAVRPRPNHVLSLLALGIGGYLAWRGSEGSCPVKAIVTDTMA